MGAAIARAMRSFAEWASARPYRLILLTIVCAHLLAPVAAALLVLDALRRGPVAAMTSAAVALLGLAALGLVFGSTLGVTFGLTGPVVIGGAACGALLSWARNLSLAFQGTVVGFVAVALAAFALVPQAAGIGEILQQQVLSLLEAWGAGAAQQAQFAGVDSGEFVRLFLISQMVSLMGALMLGFWWYSLIGEGVSFGNEFRALKLGRFAGIALIVLAIAGQLIDSELIRYVTPMAVIGFLFQGLAVLHARSYSDNWPRAVMVVVYVVLVSPLTYLALYGLSAVGLVDNFFELRARVGPDA